MYLAGDGMVPTLRCPVCEAEGTAVIMDCFLLTRPVDGTSRSFKEHGEGPYYSTFTIKNL